MSPEAVSKRIILSEAVISLYERSGTQSGRTMDMQDRLWMEIRTLGGLASQYPKMAPQIFSLISRYTAHGERFTTPPG
jgi:hypothetical protein